ncbi:MAG: hypothetical protein HBSAPP03_24730 [Phycisphaerae bacterium]|nr:MAG: hypothetical protein HBSAPP03_24730 [Phycisphaerae bacterium]
MRTLHVLTPVDFAAGAILVILAILAHAVGFEPIRRARADSVALHAQLADRTRELTEKESALVAGRAARDALRARLAEATPLETAASLNQRMAAIPDVGAGSGVRVREVVPKPIIPGKPLIRVPITIGGDGPSARFGLFLHDLHESFPDMEVVSLNVSGRPESPHEPVRFSLDLMWYTRVDQDASKAAPAEKTGVRP